MEEMVMIVIQIAVGITLVVVKMLLAAQIAADNFDLKNRSWTYGNKLTSSWTLSHLYWGYYSNSWKWSSQ
jgi:hypothetical protein